MPPFPLRVAPVQVTVVLLSPPGGAVGVHCASAHSASANTMVVSASANRGPRAKCRYTKPLRTARFIPIPHCDVDDSPELRFDAFTVATPNAAGVLRTHEVAMYGMNLRAIVGGCCKYPARTGSIAPAQHHGALLAALPGSVDDRQTTLPRSSLTRIQLAAVAQFRSRNEEMPRQAPGGQE